MSLYIVDWVTIKLYFADHRRMLVNCHVHECEICVLIALGTIIEPLNKVKRKSFDNFAMASMLRSVMVVV